MVPNPIHNSDGDFGLGGDGRLIHGGQTMTFSGISLLAAALFEGLTPGRRALKPVLDAAIERTIFD